MTLVAVGATFAAVWFWFPAAGAGLARLRGGAAASGPGRAWVSGTGAIVLGAGLAVVVAGGVAGGQAAAVALALALVALTGQRLWRRHRQRRLVVARRTEVVAAAELLAALLRVGRVPSTALAEAAAEVDVLRLAAAESRVGGDPVAALRRGASEVGREGLLEVASAWEVAVRTGASLIGALEAVSESLAAGAEVARVVETELAAARLGGRMMAVLPVAGLLLGYGFGGDPVGFLLGSAVGWACLVLGVAFACAGVLWIDEVAQRAGGR